MPLREPVAISPGDKILLTLPLLTPVLQATQAGEDRLTVVDVTVEVDAQRRRFIRLWLARS